MSTTPQNAVIYARLSWAPDGSMEKVVRQADDCRLLANRLTWGLSTTQFHPDAPPGVLWDNSVSAWQRNRKRPAWDRLLGLIGSRETDGVLVYHGDRLIRQPWDLELLLQLTDRHALPLASPSGVRNLASADDRFILRIEAAQACRSSDDTSRRVLRMQAARVDAGLPAVVGGHRMFGFRAATTVDPAEAKIIVEICDRLLARQSQYAVVAWLNTVSTTTTGGSWHPKTLQIMITNPRLAGLIVHKGTTYKAVWDPIISPEKHEEIKALFARSSAEHGYFGRERVHLLSGIARCGECNAPLVSKPSGGRNRKDSRLYGCRTKGCMAVSRNLDHLDAYVSGRALRILNDPDFLGELTAESGDPGVAAEIVALERRRDETRRQLEQLVDHPELSPDLILTTLAGFDRRIRELRNRQATDARARLLTRVAGIDRQAWEALPIDIRAETVRQLYRVTVYPTKRRGPGFDTTAVRLERV